MDTNPIDPEAFSLQRRSLPEDLRDCADHLACARWGCQDVALALSTWVSPITSKCTTWDHFKVHHFGWGFLVDGGVVGKEGMRRREFFWPAAAESLRRTRWRGLEGDGAWPVVRRIRLCRRATGAAGARQRG